MHLSAHLDLDVLAHETDDQLSVLVELTAPEQPTSGDRTPSTLVIVLDRSGSMAGPRLEQAKAAITALIDQLDPHDRFGLVAFDQHPTIAVPAGPLTDKAGGQAGHRAVHPGGSTDLSGGYLRGLQEARRVAGAAGATVLLISDGHANAGLTDPSQLGGLARQAQTSKITTSTVGMGLGYDERLLSAIASGGAGNEHFAETADEAAKLIAGEVDGLLALAVQAASLTVRMSPYVQAVQVINDLTVAGLPDGVMIELGSLYAGETRKLVLTLPCRASLRSASLRSRLSSSATWRCRRWSSRPSLSRCTSTWFRVTRRPAGSRIRWSAPRRRSSGRSRPSGRRPRPGRPTTRVPQPPPWAMRGHCCARLPRQRRLRWPPS